MFKNTIAPHGAREHVFSLFSLDTFLNNIMTQWQVQKSIDKMSTNSSKATYVRSMSDKIRSILDHEEKVSSKGEETQFRRNDEKSEEIGRKYRIMKALQSQGTKLLGNKNASLVSRTQNSQLCQNLTAEFSKPDCLPSSCKPSDPYRSIDGCCNNLEFPSQGIYILIQAKSNPILFHRHET